MMLRYLTGVHNDAVQAVAHEHQIGVLTTPRTNYRRQLALYPVWAADNSAFYAGADHRLFDFLGWKSWVRSLNNSLTSATRATCLFFTAPDAIDVGLDGRTVVGYPDETIRRAYEWLPFLRGLGLPTAIVAQPGMEKMSSQIPWDLVDVVFLGGHDAWKDGWGAKTMTALAQGHGKQVHVGRTNTKTRMVRAAQWGCDSADGTYLRFGPTENLPKLIRYLTAARAA